MISTSERPTPYIGVSGVVSPAMESRLVGMAHETGLTDTGRLLALGVKATHKTQFLDTENKYGPEWYPVGERPFMAALSPCRDSADTFAVAQVYLEPDEVGNQSYRRAFMHTIGRRGAPWMDGVQFDLLPWHRDESVMDVVDLAKERYGLSVLLQCHREAMEELGPKGVVQALGRHAAQIDYLLFDASHGTGQRMDVARLAPFLEGSYSNEQFSGTAFSVAGGLNAQNVREDIPELLHTFPGLSWDAEGQLHPANAVGKRPLDMSVVREYLLASAGVLLENRG